MGYNAYNALYMYKTLVEKAKSTKLDDMRKVIATGDACIDAPRARSASIRRASTPRTACA